MANNHQNAGARKPEPEAKPVAPEAPKEQVTQPVEKAKAPEVAPDQKDKPTPDNEPTAPGELRAGEDKVKVRATGAFLVYDPFTQDVVSSEGGEMRNTEFVRTALENGKLEEF